MTIAFVNKCMMPVALICINWSKHLQIVIMAIEVLVIYRIIIIINKNRNKIYSKIIIINHLIVIIIYKIIINIIINRISIIIIIKAIINTIVIINKNITINKIIILIKNKIINKILKISIDKKCNLIIQTKLLPIFSQISKIMK